jgi:hypothetical protein
MGCGFFVAQSQVMDRPEILGMRAGRTVVNSKQLTAGNNSSATASRNAIIACHSLSVGYPICSCLLYLYPS